MAPPMVVTGYGHNPREKLAGSGARVTLIEPFFDEPKPTAPRPEEVARAVMNAVSQPAHADISEILILPSPEAGA